MVDFGFQRAVALGHVRAVSHFIHSPAGKMLSSTPWIWRFWLASGPCEDEVPITALVFSIRHGDVAVAQTLLLATTGTNEYIVDVTSLVSF